MHGSYGSARVQKEADPAVLPTPLGSGARPFDRPIRGDVASETHESRACGLLSDSVTSPAEN